jgi:SAM-dependent methyltransferase
MAQEPHAPVVHQDPPVPPGVDPTKPSPARLYDYYLGGTNNFAVDRAVAERIRQQVPELNDVAWANRGFHQRAARWLADKQGIRQFVDIGAGLPTQGNTHEVVQQAGPGSRVAYVDNDPMVIAYAKDLLAGVAGTVVVRADLREPESVLGNPELLSLIDFAQPVALLMTFVLHFVSDASDPHRLVRRYVEALAPGSYLVISHGTGDHKPPRALQAAVGEYQKATEHGYARSKAEVERFFEGLELVEPYDGAGPRLAFAGEWGAEDPDLADSDGSRWSYCGVARCP